MRFPRASRLTLLGLAAACEHAGSGGGGPSRLATPDPVAIRVTTDTSLAGSARISAQRGGQVTTMDMESGTVYMLDFPPNTLAFDETITMTPVSRIEGLPLRGGLTAAVRLEPEGLQLAGVATLRIAQLDMESGTLRAASADPPIGFASEGDGSDFRLNAAQATDSGVALHLTRFSVRGTATGSAGDVAAQMAHPPASAPAQYEQQVAAVERGDPGAPELVEVFESYYHDVVKPLLAAASASDEALLAAGAAYRSWQREFQLRGGSDAEPRLGDENEDAITHLKKGLRAAFDRIVKRCRERGDLGGVAALLRLGRTAQLIGLEDAAFDALLPGFDAAIEACTALEVTLHSRIDFVWKDGVTHLEDEVRAAVPLEFDVTTGAIRGSGPLELVRTSGVINGNTGFVAMGGCLLPVTGAVRSGTLTVHGLSMASNPKKDAPAALGDSVSLLIGIEAPHHRLATTSCHGLLGAYAAGTQEGETWLPGWTDQHRDEQLGYRDGMLTEGGEGDDSTPVWLIQRWKPGTRGALAEREYDVRIDNVLARVTERSRLEIRRRAR